MSERPILMLDLDLVCIALGMLLFCANEFTPEEEIATLADSIRPHLKNAAEVMAQHIEKNGDLLKLCWDSGTSELVRFQMEDLRFHLSGRTAISRDSPLKLTHTTTWKPPDVPNGDPLAPTDADEE